MASVFKFISKDMLRGLGIGFLVSALLVMGYPDDLSKVQLLTDAEIKTKAKELGMVEKKEENKSTEVPDQTPAQPKEDTVAKPKPNQPKKSVSAPKKKTGPITIIIPRGAYLSDIAEILYKRGAIQDKKKFTDLAVSLKLSSKFNVGTYSIPTGAETLDIINILIKRK
jgi:hypothetical protein